MSNQQSQLAITDENNLSPDLLGQRLFNQKIITFEDLDKALAFQKKFGGRLGSILLRIGALAEDNLLKILSEQLGFPVIVKAKMPDEAQLFKDAVEALQIPVDWFLDQEVVVWFDEPDLHIWARDPLNPFVQEILESKLPETNKIWYLGPSSDLDRLLEQLRSSYETKDRISGDEISHLRELAEEAPVVELVNNTFAQAINEGASDIHIEPSERNFMVRYRIDGVLQNKLTLPRERFDAVASRLKLISAIDIAERRLPQDGRTTIRFGGKDFDVRVSALPGIWGESIVMRLLPKERQSLNLDKLGFEVDNLAIFKEWVARPHGIMLVTGPTGSGKSTTLYAALEYLNTGTDKIITIEDPVEYNIPGISQVQVNADIEYTFSRALRAILRQDPDTIMVGEVRDLETAQIAVQAALTGHLVFSTLHTNDAVSTFTRLIDMGVEPFLVASSVLGVEAQRLLRRLCPKCAAPYQPDSKIILKQMERLQERFPAVFQGEANWRQPVGCKECQGIGYKGRMGIHEIANVTKEIQDAIMSRISAKEIARIARSQGCRTLREDGLIKAWRGLTSIDEVLRVTGVVEENL
jgi:general secretion pathway protein E